MDKEKYQAELLKIEIEKDGMNAENTARIENGDSLAYCEDDYIKLSRKVDDLLELFKYSRVYSTGCKG